MGLFYYWTGNASANWSGNNFSSTLTGASTFSGGNLSASSDLTFAATGASNLTTTLGANYTVSTLTISTPDVSLTGSNTLTVNSTAGDAINVTADSGNTTISSNLAGTSAGLTKSGAGTLILSGENTYGGNTAINGGALRASHANALGTIGNGTTVSSGAALELSGGISIGAEALSLSGSGISSTGALRNISGNNAYGGVISFAGATTIGSDAGTLTLSSGSSITGTNTNLTFVGAGNTTINDAIATGTGTLTKNGTGTLTLGGSNTYTGTTTISVGALTASNASALGSTTGGTTVSSGAALQLSGGIAIGAEALSLTGSGISSGGALQNISGNNAYGGPISLAGATTIGSDAETLTLSSGSSITGTNTNLTIVGEGNITINDTIATGSGTLTKNGTGTLTLGGNNTYTGTTTINAGTLNAAASGALPTGTLSAVTINGIGSTLALGANQSAASLSGTSGSSVNLNANTLTINGSPTTTYSGSISGTGNLVKNGGSELWLDGNNSYDGNTTVNAGKLIIQHANALGTTAGGTIVASGGQLILRGNITVGAEALSLSGTGNGPFNGALNSNGVNTYGGDITLDGDSRITSDTGGWLTLSGNISLNTRNLAIAGSGNTTVNGDITASGTLIKSSSSTLTLNGNNAYTGSTTISGGTLAIGSAGRLGGGSYSANISNNSAFIYSGANSQTLSGIISGTGALTQNGTGTLVLSGNNIYSGTTTVNSGTLQAATAGALGGTSNVVLNNGGSFLVTADDAVNDNAAINLNGGRMAMSGNFNETVGALTLSANSTIDFSGFVGTLRFGSIASWAAGANLAIWNWSGTTQYGTNYGTYPNSSNLVFTNNSTLSSNLANISFYSDSGTTSIGSGFERGFTGGGNEIIAVPETETYLYAVALLAGVAVQYLRRRAKRKLLEGHRPA